LLTEKPGTDQRIYRFIVCWVLFSPLPWAFATSANFVTLTLIGNALQVLILPALAGGLWLICAFPRFIGNGNQNRWYENVVMGLLLALCVWESWEAIHSVQEALLKLFVVESANS
jgi:hypothetical protein